MAASAASLRARRILNDSGVDVGAPLVRAPRTVNEVWFAGPFVLRMSGEPGSRRLAHEARVVRLLPEEFPHPRLVGSGVSVLGEWLLMPRLDALPLSAAWAALDDVARRRSVRDLAGALRLLHGVRAPHLQPPFDEPGGVGSPHPLPAGRLLDVLDRLLGLAGVDRGVVSAAAQLVRATMGCLDPPETDHGLVHGDLHFDNVLQGRSGLAAVIDLEWARPGPPDLDLDVLLRWLAEPELHSTGGLAGRLDRASFRGVPAWLAEDYPELFAHPRLRERLTLYALAYDARALALEARVGGSSLPVHHPQRRIARLLEGRSHLHLVDGLAAGTSPS